MGESGVDGCATIENSFFPRTFRDRNVQALADFLEGRGTWKFDSRHPFGAPHLRSNIAWYKKKMRWEKSLISPSLCAKHIRHISETLSAFLPRIHCRAILFVLGSFFMFLNSQMLIKWFFPFVQRVHEITVSFCGFRGFREPFWSRKIEFILIYLQSTGVS